MMQPKKQRRKSSLDLGTMVYGKVPPQAKDLEETILGAMMLEPHSILDVTNILKPEDFYVEAHQNIYSAIVEINQTSKPVDILTVVQKLQEKEQLETVGGAYYVTKLTNSVVSSANNISWARIIKQYSIARKLIHVSGEVIGAAYDGADPLQLLREAEDLFYEVNKEIEETKITSLDAIAWSLVTKILRPELLTPEEQDLKYLYTGMKEWDRVNGMLFPGGVYVIAARPGMGKTAHAVQLIINMARKHNIGLINVEMTDEQLAKRIISNLREFNNYIYKKKPEDWTEEEKKSFYEGMQDFLTLKLHIESQTTDIDRIVQKIKFWVKKFGVRAVVIDYLQILRVADELAKYMTEVQAMNYILEKIRSTAKELDIPIFLLSQLNRELYRRAGNKEPNLGDLKGSGKIEEVAFQISFLHRPEYYEPTAVTDENGESIKGLCYQIIAKHRDGTLEHIKHRFIPQHTRFEDWQSEISTWKPPDMDTPF